MKILNDIINWIIQSGLLVWLFYFGFAVGKPFIESKIKHAKTAQQKELWTLLQQVSMTVVNSLVGKNMTGQAKFAEAVTQVQAYLENKGLNVDMKQVQSAVQSAYEMSMLTPTVNPNKSNDDKQQTTETKKADPVLEAIKTAPNRANKLTLDKTVEAKG
ncbi:phage holin, LLH family [Limosilactobacillus reuteri]|uniref:phage holin, LLH family n=1 Tax=Limosilactobacillus reuteri TaxID=1598 RepID=UPI001E34EB21|nr:phage holin, LLH family [Limosilactobacillus reuteri]MCC4499739.1 phage holin family protein [Limosilactobacillus reuteri]MCC4504142.1 phage holin family protein [Limosilactobacillus reuteri]MCC4506065.1 phage holin family protein [Limosilactobacillus reuteri]